MTITETLLPVDLVLAQIREEREQQDIKWGEQNHGNGTGSWLSSLEAERFKVANDRAEAEGRQSWSGIFLEEVYEALAEKDDDRLREELVQTAAVAVAWIECIDRRTS